MVSGETLLFQRAIVGSSEDPHHLFRTKAALVLTLRLHARYIQAGGLKNISTSEKDEISVLDEECAQMLQQLGSVAQRLDDNTLETLLPALDTHLWTEVAPETTDCPQTSTPELEAISTSSLNDNLLSLVAKTYSTYLDIERTHTTFSPKHSTYPHFQLSSAMMRRDAILIRPVRYIPPTGSPDYIEMLGSTSSAQSRYVLKSTEGNETMQIRIGHYG